jgi:short subunit dehydrogenase-like uncharacterized protein
MTAAACQTVATNRWVTLAVPGAPPSLPPPPLRRSSPSARPVFGSTLPPANTVVFSQQDPLTLALHAHGLTVSLSSGGITATHPPEPAAPLVASRKDDDAKTSFVRVKCIMSSAPKKNAKKAAVPPPSAAEKKAAPAKKTRTFQQTVADLQTLATSVATHVPAKEEEAIGRVLPRSIQGISVFDPYPGTAASTPASPAATTSVESDPIRPARVVPAVPTVQAKATVPPVKATTVPVTMKALPPKTSTPAEAVVMPLPKAVVRRAMEARGMATAPRGTPRRTVKSSPLTTVDKNIVRAAATESSKAKKDMIVEEKESATNAVGVQDRAAPGNMEVPATVPKSTESTKRVLVLVSNQSFERSVLENQRNAMVVLDAKGIKYTTLDGADPANKAARNELFALSGLRAKYPQFFVVQGEVHTFFGGMDTFNEAHEDGSLANELLGSESSAAESFKENQAFETKQPTPEGTPKELGTAAGASPSMSTQVLVLISLQSIDRSVAQNQQNVFTVLEANGIKYTTLDGADPANKEERNALFTLSGRRAKYPQFFLVNASEKTFFGGMDEFNQANEAGGLARVLGLGNSKQGAPVDTKEESKEASKGNESSDTNGKDDGKDEADEQPAENKSLEFTSVAADAITKSPVTDITIYGATSFVAKHVITYIAQTSIHLLDPLKITFAGRSAERVGGVKSEWEKKMGYLFTAVGANSNGGCKFDTHFADSGDIDGLRRMAARTKVVLNCAGPFSQYGSNVVAACAEFGTDYVDITGETAWAGEMREKYGSVAAESGARIISFCGFDSIPSDLAVFASVQALRKEFPTKTMEIETATTWHSVFGLPNGGTILTMNQLPLRLGYCFNRRVPYLLDDPLVLVAPKVRNDPESKKVRDAMALTEWYNQFPMVHAFLKGGVSAPFMMAPVNAKIVNASAVAQNYGPNFSYRERCLPVGFRGTTQLQTFSLIPAIVTQFGMIAMLILLKIPLLGSLLIKYFMPPGSGASDAACAGGYAEVYAEVCGPVKKSGKVDKANCFLKFKGDPGNWVTAQCVSESALALLLDKKDLPARSEDGFGTPSELLGPVLLKRLKETRVRPIELATHVRKSTTVTEWKMFP